MKIYATIYNNIRSDSEFLGKDIWVRCILFPKSSSVPGYARFLTMDDNNPGIVLCNFISESDLGADSPYTNRGKCVQAVLTRQFSVQKIPICTPVETRTTQELLPTYTGNSANTFEEFVGQDVWVLSRLKNSTYKYYVKIIDIKDNYMKYKSIGSEYVDVDDIYELESMPSGLLDGLPRIIHLDSWEVCEPLDILTDEEMREILEYNDKIYWGSTLEAGEEEE